MNEKKKKRKFILSYLTFKLYFSSVDLSKKIYSQNLSTFEKKKHFIYQSAF